MAKVSRTYRIEQKTADKITEIAENENMTATEVVEDAIRAYSPGKYIGNTANKVGSTAPPRSSGRKGTMSSRAMSGTSAWGMTDSKERVDGAECPSTLNQVCYPVLSGASIPPSVNESA